MPTLPTLPLPQEQVMLVTSYTPSARFCSVVLTCGRLFPQGKTAPYSVLPRWVLFWEINNILVVHLYQAQIDESIDHRRPPALSFICIVCRGNNVLNVDG